MASSGEDASWATMPRKDQVFILFLVRFVEPAIRGSVSTYLYYQLQSLDPQLTSGQIIRQSTSIQTAYIVGQCLSSFFLGRLADSPKGGRKRVLMLGLSASSLTSASLGFISNFKQGIFLVGLEGIFNGNVATARTMVTEVVREKKFQARAFVLFPIASNLAILLAPLMASQLADLAGNYPKTFDHVWFLKAFPYAPPALFNGIILLTTFLMVFFFLEETSPQVIGRYDYGLAITRRICSLIGLHRGEVSYARLRDEDGAEVEAISLMRRGSSDPDSPRRSDSGYEDEDEDEDEEEKQGKREVIQSTTSDSDWNVKVTQVLPTRRMFTANLCLMVLVSAIQDGHTAAYGSLWPNFLSDPKSTDHTRDVLPFRFSGGAGMSPPDIAKTYTIVGALGLPIQFLVYPRVSQKIGAVRTWRLFMRGFPLVYLLAPFIAVMSWRTAWAQWSLLFVVQVVLVGSTVFVMPAQLLLLRLASPHPSALARTNSISYVASGAARALAMAIGGAVYSYGTAHTFTGLAWWIAGGVAVCNCFLTFLCKEGNGHNIWMAGDEE